MTKCIFDMQQITDVMPDITHSTKISKPIPWFNVQTMLHRRHPTTKNGFHIPTVFHSWLALLIIFNSVHIASCQNTLQPSITSSAQYLEELKPASLTCRLSTTVTPTTGSFPLSWSRNGGLPSSASTSESQQPGSGGAVTYQSVLTFTPAALDNEVPIVCNANIDSSTGVTSYNPLVILVPEIPVITGPSTVDALENQTWTCQIDGASRIAPNVYWRNGLGEALTRGVSKSTTITLVPNENTVYIITQYITLAIPATSPEYNLSCVVVHELGQYNSLIASSKTVSVLLPPQITKNGGNTVYVNEGQQTTLSCIIRVSNPPANNVSWTKDSVSVNLGSARYGSVNTSSPSLTILSAVRGDHGDYVCTVANSKGSASFTTPTTLIVRYLPTVGSTNDTTVEGSAGGSLTIPCPVDSVPLPTAIVWKRIVNGQALTINITGNSRYSGGTINNKQYNLTINPLQSDDAGTYFCEAVNELGTGTGPNLTTVVNSNPVVNIPATLEAQESYTFTITCTITMYPAVTSVTWFKGTTQLNIAASSGKYSGGTVQNASLTVRTAVKADGGSYRCQGSNGTASVSGTAVVTITYPPKVTTPASAVTGTQGQTVIIPCNVDAVPPATSIEWKKYDIGASNNTATLVSIGGRISGGNLTTPSLTIDNLQPSDTASYFCIVSNSYGNTTSNPVSLTVQYTPVVRVSASPTVLRIGESFQLSCTADANPAPTRFQWYNGSVVISNTANFTRAQATYYDYTDFRCSVTNSLGVTSAIVRPNIQLTPQLVGTGKVIIVAKVQSNITMECLVLANPEPTSYAWYKEGTLISNGTLKNVTIFLSSEAEFGSYSCGTQNSFGNLNPAREFTMVEEKTAVEVLPSLEAQEGYNFTIPCQIFMYPAVTSVAWFKGTTQLNIAASSGKYSGGTVQNASLTVRNAVKADGGSYRCQGSNGTASVSGTTVVTITYPPKVTTPSSDVTGTQGQTVIIPCNVDAVPPATSIEWKKYDIGASNNTATLVIIGGRISGGNFTTPSLTISNLDPSDTASYFCIVSNSYGNTTSNPVSLTVQYKPVVQVAASPNVLRIGESFQLSCTADANPAPTRFQWYNGSVVISNTANFTRAQATYSDYTDFRCSVTNTIGVTSATIRPNIQFTPQLVGTGKEIIFAKVLTNITLDCLVLANPEPTSYTWYQEGALISTGNQKNLTVFLSNEAAFGSYSCGTQNSFGNLNPAREFTLIEDKTVVEVLASLEAQEGYNFTIPCRIVMYPAVTSIVWFKGTTQLNIAASSGKYSGGTVQNASLTVRNAVKADGGSYKCQGSNGTASVSGTTIVTITYPPKVTTPSSAVTGTQGQTVIIPCNVDAVPPATSIEWKKYDIGASNATATLVIIGGRISGGNITTPSLTISNLDPSNTASYFCIVSNSYGNTTSNPVSLTVQYKPVVQVAASPSVLRIGESFQLSCTADANPAPTRVQWYNGSVVISNTANFTRAQATYSDYTDFRCSVTNSLGVTSATIRPNIQFTPQLVGTGKEIIFAKVLTNITLDCLVLANPEPTSYTWYQEGTLISSGNQKNLTVFLSNEAAFGSYSCGTQNSFGNLNPAREFTVIEDKTVVEVLASLEAQEGYNFTIPCRIVMHPAVTSIVWFKGTTQLNIAASSGKYSGGTVQNASLTVRTAVKADGGSYRCQGSNGTSSVSGTTVVTITYPPKVTTPSSNVIGILGQTVTIPCNVDAVPPATSIEWKKYDIGASNNTATIVTIGGRISGGNITIPSLTISNLDPSDTASYFCIVSNSYGNTTSNPVSMTVQYKPIVQVSVSPSVLKLGESFQLSCTADASPAPTRVQWYKGSALISNTPTFMQTQASVSDYIDFRCSVTNSVGVTSETVKPNIQFSPQLVGTGKVTISAKINTNATLDCLVIANPEPTSYVWYKEGQVIPTATQKTMIVFLLNQTDFTSYNCSTQNSFGDLNPAREFTVVQDTGSNKSTGLSTSIIILIVVLAIIFLILLILLIVCCCLYGICAKKRKKSKVDPNNSHLIGDNNTVSSKPSVPPFDSKPNGSLNDDDFIVFPSKLDSGNNHGSIISVPEKTGARPYHLPPLDPLTESVGNRQDEKRRSRRKKQKVHKSEEKSALTGSEERAGSVSPTT